MTKFPDPIGLADDGDANDDESTAGEGRPSLQPVAETGQAPRGLPRPPKAARRVVDPSEQIEELELRLREWVARVDTLETELDYLKKDLEVRIAYARELERQLDEQAETVRNAVEELVAMRARASYRMVDAAVRRLGRIPGLDKAVHDWARRMIAWRDR
jgi:cell division protein FtsB